jgi:hypothetical protein
MLQGSAWAGLSTSAATCMRTCMKAMRATSALRTLQEGCHDSGWCEEMERHILTLVSNRPVGVSITKAGGLKG